MAEAGRPARGRRGRGTRGECACVTRGAETLERRRVLGGRDERLGRGTPKRCPPDGAKAEALQ
eukprot:2523553-Prymnesium_polylepis.1